jgi:hypothetical protein
MLYSLFILTFGIYLGQEYNTIPSIKSTVVIALNFINNKVKEHDKS